MGFIARLSQSVPLMIVMAVAAIIIYLVVTYRHSPARAKEILITVFTWVGIVIAAFFGLVCLYALFEGNSGVLDLGLCFLVVGLVCLAITRWCNHVFLKHHPHYKSKAQTAKVKRRFPWAK